MTTGAALHVALRYAKEDATFGWVVVVGTNAALNELWMCCPNGVSRCPSPQRTTTGWQAPLAVALTTSRCVVKCCGWLDNSRGHGCGHVLAAVVMMFGVVSSRLPLRAMASAAPLAAALQITARSAVKCCGWLGNSCGHGCGYDLAAVVMMYGVVSSRLP